MTPGEGAKLGCNTLTLKKGKYIGQTIKNYQEDIQSIASTFQELLKHPGLDPEGYCVEWYISNKDVLCMIRLDNE